MKKSYLMIAAAAGLMLAACSQEDDFVAQNAAAEQGDGAVLFDTYLSNNSTRAGQTGTMTTKTLQDTGFGVIAWTGSISGLGAVKTAAPNYMWNQEVRYVASNWTYSPIKYWPNETTDDSATSTSVEGQSTANNEGVDFYAYAPYVNEISPIAKETADGYTSFAKQESTADNKGIISITANDATSDPMIHYLVADGSTTTAVTRPSASVDLLWGVSSGFSYHPVNKRGLDGSALVGTEIVTMPAGLPVEKMQKPAIDEKVKFDFKHALARIGMTVIGAFDQVAQGGTLDNNTRITIKEVTVTGKDFAIGGALNLNNTTANRALWITDKYVYTDMSSNPKTSTITLSTTNSGYEINPNLQWKNDITNAYDFPKVFGVKNIEQNLIVGSEPWTEASSSTPNYEAGITYYSADKKPIAQTSANIEYAAGKYYLYDAIKKQYTEKTNPDFDISDSYLTMTAPTKVLSAAGSRPTKVDANTYFEKSGDVYTVIAYNKMPETFETADCEKYYTTTTASIVAAVATYKSSAGVTYTVNTTPGYFMVIPTTSPTNPAEATVTVKITYYVTTRDSKLTQNTSYVENIIKQDVTLGEFTNGKSYNLKLILGLTSVKVDAEVSNWETGTVESNLPQNLE